MNTPSIPDVSHDPSQDDSLITTRQLCKLVGDRTPMTLWRWVRDGLIPPPVKINGQNYYRKRETLERLMHGNVPDLPPAA